MINWIVWIAAAALLAWALWKVWVDSGLPLRQRLGITAGLAALVAWVIYGGPASDVDLTPR